MLLVAAFGAGCKGFFVAPTLTSITINPASPSVQLSQTTTLQAFGVDSNGTGQNLTSGVSWSSSDNTIATVTGNGSAILTGVSLGNVTITASAESVQNTASATVFIQVSSLTIQPLSQSMQQGATTADPFVITAVTATGNVDISSSATLTAYASNGTQQTTITCTYDPAGTNGAGQYCTDNGGTPTGAYKLVATYTGTTQTAQATLNIN